MLKYGLLAKGIELVCFKPALKALKQVYPDLDEKNFKKNVKREFKGMLLRTPDVGGSFLESNLYVAAFVFSFYKADKSKITPEIVNTMVDSVFESQLLVKLHKFKRCTLFDEKVQNEKMLKSKESQHSKYELDWKFEYIKGKDEFFNTFTECGICKLGLKENCFQFVPCLCNMDERHYRLEGGELRRTKTLADGKDCCDFHVTRIRK